MRGRGGYACLRPPALRTGGVPPPARTLVHPPASSPARAHARTHARMHARTYARTLMCTRRNEGFSNLQHGLLFLRTDLASVELVGAVLQWRCAAGVALVHESPLVDQRLHAGEVSRPHGSCKRHGALPAEFGAAMLCRWVGNQRARWRKCVGHNSTTTPCSDGEPASVGDGVQMRRDPQLRHHTTITSYGQAGRGPARARTSKGWCRQTWAQVVPRGATSGCAIPADW